MKQDLLREVQQFRRVKAVPVRVDQSTDASEILSILPAKNPDPQSSGGPTPPNLQGVFWMRGNPLPDYLLSFANFHWTRVGATPFGFLATFAPTSFAFKQRIVARGAAPQDYSFVPEICRVPKEDGLLARLARLEVSHDPKHYARPISEDLDLLGKPGSEEGVSNAMAENFIESVWSSGQLPELDGGELVRFLARESFFYEAKFNRSFNRATVTIFRLLPVSITPLQVPEAVASFSLAPHPEDPDVYIRKSFILGKSKVPNYYWLTRIVDGQGAPTPHFREFLQCVEERSDGRILKVEADNASEH